MVDRDRYVIPLGHGRGHSCKAFCELNSVSPPQLPIHLPKKRGPMAGQKSSVEELFRLQAQGDTKCLFTLEPLPDERLVRLTPWVEGVGCLCLLAFPLERAAIIEVELSGDSHRCGGKELRVALVNFADSHRAITAVVAAQASALVAKTRTSRQAATEARDWDPPTEPEDPCGYCYFHMKQRQMSCSRISDPNKRQRCFDRAREWYEDCLDSCQDGRTA